MVTSAKDIKKITGSAWVANLELTYAYSPLRTVISHRKHVGPLLVQKAFYPEGEVCHSYLIHPPGGVVGGDEIRLAVKVESCAHALITTPAANKFYRSSGKTALLKQTITVDENALMEWLPQESIVFEGSQVNMSTLVELTHKSRFIGWEVTCLGRPASGDHYENGSCFQRLEISVDGKPRLLDRIVIDNNNGFRAGPWGLGNNEVMAALVVYPANKDNLQTLRNTINNTNSEMLSLGVSLLDDLLICRGMAKEAGAIKAALQEMWVALRPEIMRRPACPPRIWKM